MRDALRCAAQRHTFTVILGGLLLVVIAASDNLLFIFLVRVHGGERVFRLTGCGCAFSPLRVSTANRVSQYVVQPSRTHTTHSLQYARLYSMLHSTVCYPLQCATLYSMLSVIGQ